MMKSYYVAEKNGLKITGSAKELGEKFGMNDKFVYSHSTNGTPTKDGWMISRGSPRRLEFIATHPEDDPIVGDVYEVAALLGIDQSTVYEDARLGVKTKGGWTIRYKGDGNGKA